MRDLRRRLCSIVMPFTMKLLAWHSEVVVVLYVPNSLVVVDGSPNLILVPLKSF